MARTSVLIICLYLVVPQHASSKILEPGDTLAERAAQCSTTFCMPGRYEFRFLNTSNYALDAKGTEHGVNNLGIQRLRVRPRLVINSNAFIEAEADLMTGRVFGDQSNNNPDLNLSDPGNRQAFSEPQATDLRQLYLSWRLPFGLFRLGQQTSNYGLGLIANNGDDEAHDVFDDPVMGDIVERALFAR
ncbi:MAG TPA: hypothetical protein EYN06_09290, partial [Myxococcales bacterium]|nr:hypothetical protein [Myxococcales bacterium]